MNSRTSGRAAFPRLDPGPIRTVLSTSGGGNRRVREFESFSRGGDPERGLSGSTPSPAASNRELAGVDRHARQVAFSSGVAAGLGGGPELPFAGNQNGPARGGAALNSLFKTRTWHRQVNSPANAASAAMGGVQKPHPYSSKARHGSKTGPRGGKTPVAFRQRRAGGQPTHLDSIHACRSASLLTNRPRP